MTGPSVARVEICVPAIDILILREVLCGGISHDFENSFNRGVEVVAVDILVERVGVVVAGGEVHRRHTQLRGHHGDVAEGAPISHEPLAGDVRLKLIVGALIVDCIVLALAVDFHKRLQPIQFLGQLAFLVVLAELLRADAANLLVAGEQEPGLLLGGAVDLHQRVHTAAVVAADALGGHQDVAVLGLTNLLHALLVNRVHVGHQHDRDLARNEDVAPLAGDCRRLEHSAELGVEHLLRGHQKVFQSVHADTSVSLLSSSAKPSEVGVSAAQSGQSPSSNIQVS